MPKFTLEVACGNAAFDPGCGRIELARILRDLAQRLDDDGALRDSGRVFDVNGNRVGAWAITDGEG